MLALMFLDNLEQSCNQMEDSEPALDNSDISLSNLPGVFWV